MDCKKNCKWIGYDYITDECGHIITLREYKCEKYKTNLGNKLERCTKCIDADMSRKSYKDKIYKE